MKTKNNEYHGSLLTGMHFTTSCRRPEAAENFIVRPKNSLVAHDASDRVSSLRRGSWCQPGSAPTVPGGQRQGHLQTKTRKSKKGERPEGQRIQWSETRRV